MVTPPLTQPKRIAFQRYHHRLKSGHTLMAQTSSKKSVPVMFMQGALDGACGLHVLCTVLSILGLARPVGLEALSRRQTGVPARLWQAFSDTFFTGVDAADLVDRLTALELPLTIKLVNKRGTDIDAFAVTSVMQGELVAVTFDSIRNRRTRHWALCCGIEGITENRKHWPTALLMLDPSAAEPSFGAAFNARLRITDGIPVSYLISKTTSKRRITRMDWQYESAIWNAEPVRLTAAVRIGLSACQS